MPEIEVWPYDAGAQQLGHAVSPGHHLLCLGTLARCHEHVPADLQAEIKERAVDAEKLGMPVTVPGNW